MSLECCPFLTGSPLALELSCLQHCYFAKVSQIKRSGVDLILVLIVTVLLWNDSIASFLSPRLPLEMQDTPVPFVSFHLVVLWVTDTAPTTAIPHQK